MNRSFLSLVAGAFLGVLAAFGATVPAAAHDMFDVPTMVAPSFHLVVAGADQNAVIAAPTDEFVLVLHNHDLALAEVDIAETMAAPTWCRMPGIAMRSSPSQLACFHSDVLIRGSPPQ